MTNTLMTKEQVADLIKEGKKLILAGDEKVLSELPNGEWIAGTIPYFIGENGGEFSQEKVFVTELPDYVTGSTINSYTNETIENVYAEAPDNSFSIIIIPASSKTHLSFSLNSANYKDFALKPIAGWISGVFLDELGKKTPKVYNGTTREAIEDGAVVFNLQLPENKAAEIQIINIFKQGEGDTIVFPEDGFVIDKAVVNGESVNFAEYLTKNNIDTKLPLVADVFGEMINTSFQGIDEENKKVNLYAPVFKDVEYKVAAQVGDYTKSFSERIPADVASDKVFFTCNCILNYLYAELEGKKTSNFAGPITFGEIAYQLLNQTFVFVSIVDV